jgi:hypothetical protein
MTGSSDNRDIRIQEFRVDAPFPTVVMRGEFRSGVSEAAFLETIDMLHDSATWLVLVDARQVTGEPGVLARFLYGEFVAAAAARFAHKRPERPVPRFAYVMEAPLLDPARLGETVATNRGMRVRAFASVDEAQRWLASQAKEAGA